MARQKQRPKHSKKRHGWAIVDKEPTAAKSKKTKSRVKRNSKKVCVTLMEIARKFPDIAKQVCFHPKVSSFKSIMGTPASAKKKMSTFL